MSAKPFYRYRLKNWVVALLLTAVPLLAVAQQPINPDVRLVVDISGSMKQNDPGNLRQPAVELLTQLLPAGSKSGVWTFGQYVNMLVSHKVVDDAWKAEAMAKANEINSVGLFTNIGLALEKAAYDKPNDDGQYATSVILLTDGMVDIGKDPKVNQAEWRRIVDEVVPGLNRAGIRVHTIALSDNADTQLLSKIALATGGKAALAKSADELMKAFLGAFDQAAPAEQVPLAGDRFAVDSSVEEFTALIFRQEKIVPTVLEGPDGTRYSYADAAGDASVSWHSGLDYDLITLKQPLEGEWKVVTGIAPDSRVTVVSNLNLVVKPMPANLFRGQRLPIDVRLQEDGKTVTAQDFLRLVDLTVTTTGEELRLSDNLSASGVPGDGIYRTRLDHFNELGEFQVTIVLDGKSFQRQIKHSVSVRDAFSVEFNPATQPGMPYELSVTPYIQTIDLKKTSVIARIKTPSGQTSILPVPPTQVDDWLLKYSPQEDGIYQVSLAIDVVETNGSDYEYQHPTFQFSYPDGKVVGELPKPEEKSESPVEQEPATEEPEKKGTPWWIFVALGVGNLVILILAYVAYRLVMGGKKEAAEESESDSKPAAGKTGAVEKEAEKAPAPAKPAATETLAMADIGEEDDLEVLDEIDTATDLSSDESLKADISMDAGSADVPDAPMDDLEAMLAEATADLPDLDDGDDEEFTLDDFEEKKS